MPSSLLARALRLLVGQVGCRLQEPVERRVFRETHLRRNSSRKEKSSRNNFSHRINRSRRITSMNQPGFKLILVALVVMLALAIMASCAPAPTPTPVPPTTAPTALPRPTAVAPTATAQRGIGAADVEKLVNGKLNTVNRDLALWNIQAGVGTVMIEYGNRLSRLWFAANSDNWDMAKYQLGEMTELQEVGETTRPARKLMLTAFESNFLDPLDKAIAAKDSKAFDDAYAKAVGGCNGCHAASTGGNWKSYQFVKIQTPAQDNNDYIAWKADKSTGSYIANPPAAATATPKPTLAGVLDAAGAERLVNAKFNTVDRTLTLWDIQPGLGTVMIEYARRLAQLKYALDAGNWDMAKYQLDEMTEIQEVAEITRPARKPMLTAFEDANLKPMDDAIMAKDKDKANAALQKMIADRKSVV